MPAFEGGIPAVGAAAHPAALTREVTDLESASDPSKFDRALAKGRRLRRREPTVCSPQRAIVACDGSSREAQRAAVGDRGFNKPPARKTARPMTLDALTSLRIGHPTKVRLDAFARDDARLSRTTPQIFSPIMARQRRRSAA
jgi:hypothetical protein